MMLKASQVLSQWAGVVRNAAKQRQMALLDDVQAAHAEISSRFHEELGTSSTLERLAEIETMMAEEASQTRVLVQEFFEYQHKFEVDLVSDRAQDAAEQRSRLAALKVEVMDEVEGLETRVREELVGCVVRCDGISREIDSIKAERADAEDEVYATRAKAEAVSKQLAGMQKVHTQNVESERVAIRRLEDKVLELQTRSGQTQKEMHACRAELRAAAAAAAKARGEAALVRHVDYDEKFKTQPPPSTQPAPADEGRLASEPSDSTAMASAAQLPSQQASDSAVSSNSNIGSKRYSASRRGGSPARGNTRGHSPGRYTRTPRSSTVDAEVDANAQVPEGVPQDVDERRETPRSTQRESATIGGGKSLKSRAPALPGRDASRSVYRPKVAARRNSRDRTAMPDE